METLLTPEEAAARISVSPRSIREWLRKGKIKGVKAGRLWRIREKELERFLGFESGKINVEDQGDPFLKVRGRFRGSSLSPEGSTLIKTKNEILTILKKMKPELEEDYHVKSIGLFGSVVRDETRGDSDIDVLVEFRHPIGMFRFLELEEFLSERLGGKVDLVSKKALKPEIGRAILSEVVLTWNDQPSTI
jgi:uncharacterized protein